MLTRDSIFNNPITILIIIIEKKKIQNLQFLSNTYKNNYFTFSRYHYKL